MAKGIETKIEHAERSRLYKKVEKDTSRGPYSKNERIHQAVDIKTKQIVESERRAGREITHTKANEIAQRIAEHRDKRFR